MKTVQQKSNLNLTIYLCVVISLILTPTVNKDSLVIPKMIVLFCLALYLLPGIILRKKLLTQNNYFKSLTIVVSLIIIQLLVVLITSKAPLEQQIFGRTGRGLGFITVISLLILMVHVSISIRSEDLKKIIYGIVFSAIFSSIYSISQQFGYDFVKWDNKNNGIIGTLGNPNFQSIFAAMVFLPATIIFLNKKNGKFYSVAVGIVLMYTVFITQSTQGYIGILASIVVYISIYYWHKKKQFFYFSSVLTIIVGFFLIAGMLNRGPLSSLLYKISVQSRGDFWRSAFNMANKNPFFGVGLDSFGDNYLKYRDGVAANHSFAEFTDNAHNYFLESAATCGYIMLVLNLIIIMITFISFINILNKTKKFNKELTALFTTWIVFQLQSFISPGNLVLMTWNMVISGLLIGIAANLNDTNSDFGSNFKLNLARMILVVAGLIFIYPLFNVDRLELQSMKTRNGDLAISSAISYPESVLRYSTLTRELFDSKLYDQSLYLAKKAVDFNPYAASGWVMILISPNATLQEKQKAKSEIIKLDPLNSDVRNFIIK